jgi:hypothetical protein
MKRLVSVLVAVVVLAVLAGFCLRAFSDPVPMGRLHRLRKGMTQDEVRSVLGPPAKIYESGQWTYQRRLVFGYVNIHWQAGGTYGGDFNYERF